MNITEPTPSTSPEIVRKAAMLYCERGGLDPKELTHSLDGSGSQLTRLDLMERIIGHQLMVAVCLEDAATSLVDSK